ncbi:hypothetical protein ACVETW_16660, partial [Acinetobacter baumannii]
MDYSWCKIGRSLRAGLVGFARTPSEKEDPSSLKSSFMQSLNLILILDQILFFYACISPLTGNIPNA